MLEAIKLKGRVDADTQVVILEAADHLPEGEVEVILLYEQVALPSEPVKLSPLDWPSLDGGQYLGGTLRRQEIYDDDNER
jgi:hypothetical protein